MMSTNDVSVQRMRPDDYAAVFEVARALASWFRPIDQMALAIDLTQHEGFVAWRGPAPIGFVTFHTIDAEVAELSWLGVHPDAHGQGVGSLLVETLEAELRRRGIERVQVGTVDETTEEPAFEATRRFYVTHGFQQVGYDRDFYSRGRHRVLYEKDLSSTS